MGGLEGRVAVVAAARSYFAPMADRLAIVEGDVTALDGWRAALDAHDIRHVVHGASREPVDAAAVEMVGDVVENDTLGLPSGLALPTPFALRTGVPRAILDAGGTTDMRAGAVTAIGGHHLARLGIGQRLRHA